MSIVLKRASIRSFNLSPVLLLTRRIPLSSFNRLPSHSASCNSIRHNSLHSNNHSKDSISSSPSHLKDSASSPSHTKDASTPAKLGDAAPAPESVAKSLVESEPPKLSLWEKIKHEAQHYWDGTKLLGYEIKVSTKLLLKLISGYALSRREQAQLQRTLVDLARLVPFSMFVLVPFAELLLPIALKFFPNLLPSTYESKLDRAKKRTKLALTRTLASDYIKKTMEELNGLRLSKKITPEEREAFVLFFHTISMGMIPTHLHLVRVARLFKNDQVLDNLLRPQLVAMTKYMSLRPFGTDSILRYQIRHRLLNIIKDDKAIDYEGVDLLTVPELQTACSQRGIKSIDVPPARLRQDLQTWLDLRLRQKIPLTLLILSSTYTYGELAHGLESYYDALLAVLLSIPDEVYNVAKLELSDDLKLKLDILKEQNELINEENLREKDTVNQVKDTLKLDDYEELATDGIKFEEEGIDGKKGEKSLKEEKPLDEDKPLNEDKPSHEEKQKVLVNN